MRLYLSGEGELLLLNNPINTGWCLFCSRNRRKVLFCSSLFLCRRRKPCINGWLHALGVKIREAFTFGKAEHCFRFWKVERGFVAGYKGGFHWFLLLHSSKIYIIIYLYSQSKNIYYYCSSMQLFQQWTHLFQSFFVKNKWCPYHQENDKTRN